MNPFTWELIPGEPTTAALLVGGVLVPLCLWLIWRSPMRRLRPLRCVLSLFAVAALVCIGLPLAYRQSTEAGTVLLLTEGSNANLVTAAINDGIRPERVYRLENVPAWSDLEASTIPSAAWLWRNEPPFERLHLVGFGLTAEELAVFENIDIAQTAAVPQPGFAHLDAPLQAVTGETISIFTRVRGPESKNQDMGQAKVRLVEPGGTTTEIVLSENGRHRFSSTAKAVGRFLYRLELRDADDALLAEETFGLMVRPPQKTRVLILEAAPHADTRFLRQTLLSSGFPFLIRTQISKDQYRWQVGNRDERTFGNIDANLLAEFDLVIAGQRVLNQLSTGEMRTLARQVRESGLGLLIKADQLPSVEQRSSAPISLSDRNRLGSELVLASLPMNEAREVQPRLTGKPGILTPISADPFEFMKANGQQSLIEDRMGRALAVSAISGMGRIGSSLIFDTASWPLRGNDAEHGAYWQHLMDHLARPQKASDRWHIKSGSVPASAHRSVNLQLTMGSENGTATTTVPAITLIDPVGNQMILPPAQNPRYARQWTSRFVPLASGWHRLQANDGHFDAYVAPNHAWQTALQTVRLDATARAANQAPIQSDAKQAGTLRPLQKWPFATILAAALITLWLIRKHRS